MSSLALEHNSIDALGVEVIDDSIIVNLSNGRTVSAPIEWFHPLQRTNVFKAIIEREDSIYVSFCPELDIASQGSTIEEAKENWKEAVELFLESADQTEIQVRIHVELYVTKFDVTVG